MKERMKGSLSLLTATVIWGFAFIAQSVGMDLIGPFTFQMVRCFLAVATLIPCSFLLDLGKCSPGQSAKKWKNPDLWKAGCICGCALFVASSLQQIGLVYTDAGKAGFITALYIVLVPVIGIFIGKKLKPIIVASVLIALLGLYFLCVQGSNGFSLPGWEPERLTDIEKLLRIYEGITADTLFENLVYFQQLQKF